MKDKMDFFAPKVENPEREAASEKIRDIHRFIREKGMNAEAVERALFLMIDRGQNFGYESDDGPAVYAESEYELARMMQSAEEEGGLPLNEITRVLYDRQRTEARPALYLRFVEGLAISDEGKTVFRNLLERNLSGNVVFTEPHSENVLLTAVIPKGLEDMDLSFRAGWLLFTFKNLTDALRGGGVDFDVHLESAR